MCHHLETFRKLGAHVVLVSFGSPSSAVQWLRETAAPFSVWLDPGREAYRAFGVDRSLFRSWGPRTIMTYARLMLEGRSWRGIQGDSSQLGGGFIVDTSGHPLRPPQPRSRRSARGWSAGPGAWRCFGSFGARFVLSALLTRPLRTPQSSRQEWARRHHHDDHEDLAFLLVAWR